MFDCINLAAKGIGAVSPNPLVGCIIIKNNRIIGKGHHKKYGEAHAEVNAINDAKRHAKSLRGASLYVNLEPCSHTGKTPPCTDIIVKEGIKKVFIGTKDINPLVNGKGIQKLKKAGLQVVSGILEDDCKEINKTFFFASKFKRPYVTLKFAQSIDGFIALNNFKSKWITNIYTRKIAHNIRAFNDAVLIGGRTLIKDNPALDCRLSDSMNTPDAVIISGGSSVNLKARIFSVTGRSVYVYTGEKVDLNSDIKNIKIKHIKSSNKILNLKLILKDLHREGINSILVEGGSYTLSQFIKQKLYEEIYVMIAPKMFGNGISPFSGIIIDSINGKNDLILNDFYSSGNDIIINYKKYR
ncbi:MAG: bifunctional diaminohydroxyphosphoribosylaminopyrimidine deaminase/5-amino-6-(5-phosphoribosylamino)uracil reductase RibD [Ignavibacteria bacterium]|nr:bifunctional diaminohydroxyphosphoribosylaminopyrimidine deaminase/5-amino-6-(5-phosphoribosylamino)uracil reductase RibD [Ignavibacteria bacterium]